MGAASIYTGACMNRSNADQKIFLLRYDTEWWGEQKAMDGFFEQVLKVHQADKIPASFFCTGKTLNNRKKVFKDFYAEVKNDPLFDFQNHSYEHIGLCKKEGEGLAFEKIKADYQKAFDMHEEVFGKRPIGIAMCGTEGESYKAFDSNKKTKREFEMLAGLGMKMINTHLTGLDEGTQFSNYGRLGYPGIMGFPSAYSDTGWMWRRAFGDPVAYIISEIDKRAEKNQHMPLMLHDWVAWQHAPDKELGFLREIIEHARKKGYQLRTHIDCYQDKKLWKT